MPGGAWEGSAWRMEKKRTFTGKILYFYTFTKKKTMMKILRALICAALLVTGLSGCEKIDVNKLEGTWSEQYDPTVFGALLPSTLRCRTSAMSHTSL